MNTKFDKSVTYNLTSNQFLRSKKPHILLSLLVSGCCSSSQICDCFEFSSFSSAAKTLNHLKNDKLLLAAHNSKLSGGYVYYLSSQGYEVAQHLLANAKLSSVPEPYVKSVTRRKYSFKYGNVVHSARINDVFYYLLKYFGFSNFQWFYGESAEFVYEDEYNLLDGDDTDTKFNKLIKKSDATFIVNNRKFVLEVDRGTEGIKRVFNKLNDYAQIFSSILTVDECPSIVVSVSCDSPVGMSPRFISDTKLSTIADELRDIENALVLSNNGNVNKRIINTLSSVEPKHRVDFVKTLRELINNPLSSLLGSNLKSVSKLCEQLELFLSSGMNNNSLSVDRVADLIGLRDSKKKEHERLKSELVNGSISRANTQRINNIKESINTSTDNHIYSLMMTGLDVYIDELFGTKRLINSLKDFNTPPRDILSRLCDNLIKFQLQKNIEHYEILSYRNFSIMLQGISLVGSRAITVKQSNESYFDSVALIEDISNNNYAAFLRSTHILKHMCYKDTTYGDIRLFLVIDSPELIGGLKESIPAGAFPEVYYIYIDDLKGIDINSITIEFAVGLLSAHLKKLTL